jgi:hypothetical protein
MFCNAESSWNVMAHSDAREGRWRGNWRMEWVASTLYTTSEHGLSNITTADAHNSAGSIRMNWRPRQFKWTRPFRRKRKSGFCACAITFQTQSAWFWERERQRERERGKNIAGGRMAEGSTLCKKLTNLGTSVDARWIILSNKHWWKRHWQRKTEVVAERLRHSAQHVRFPLLSNFVLVLGQVWVQIIFVRHHLVK